MTEGNFWGCGKLHALDWLFFLGYVPFLELRLVLKLSNITALVMSFVIAPLLFTATKNVTENAVSQSNGRSTFHFCFVCSLWRSGSGYVLTIVAVILAIIIVKMYRACIS